MAAAKRKSIAKLCLALGLFVLAGFFRQADRVGAPLPSAAFFLLTNLIYIGLAMGWGFSISRRILHRCDRRWLLLGCAMAVLWLFLRTVKYRFFNDDTVGICIMCRRFLRRCSACSPRCSLGGAMATRFRSGGICYFFRRYA